MPINKPLTKNDLNSLKIIFDLISSVDVGGGLNSCFDGGGRVRKLAAPIKSSVDKLQLLPEFLKGFKIWTVGGRRVQSTRVTGAVHQASSTGSSSPAPMSRIPSSLNFSTIKRNQNFAAQRLAQVIASRFSISHSSL
ncbi:hypothetical protein ACFE04_022339 [Oxalis oulophora]